MRYVRGEITADIKETHTHTHKKKKKSWETRNHKTPRRIGSILFDINLAIFFFRYFCSDKGNWNKNEQMGPNQT